MTRLLVAVSFVALWLPTTAGAAPVSFTGHRESVEMRRSASIGPAVVCPEGTAACPRDEPPAVVGKVALGEQLVCQPGHFWGTWSAPTLEYEWVRNGVVVQTGATYTLSAADEQREVWCIVTATLGTESVSAESVNSVMVPAGIGSEGKEENERTEPPREEQANHESKEHQEASAPTVTASTEARTATNEQHVVVESAPKASGEQQTARDLKLPAALHCTVPSLRGDSLERARVALSNAHCRVGRLTRRHRGHTALVVIRQEVEPGTKLADGASVGLTLGRSRRRFRT